MLQFFLAQLNRDARARTQANKDLLALVDDLAASEGKKVWLGLEGWYADFPENEKQ